MVELHRQKGAAWIEQIPALLGQCARRWSLTIGPAFEPLSYNYVAPATLSDGSEAVLKIGYPNPELTAEIEALRLFGGRGSALLLDADAAKGILLLERLKPGEKLTGLPDERAISIACQVMRQLWRPAPARHSFPTVGNWASGLKRLRQAFDGGCGPFPTSLIESADRVFSELISTAGKPLLLHGDLHHGNILSAQRQAWLALDPKGVIGEAVYEVGALLRNPMPQLLEQPDTRRVLARRVHQLAEELGFDRERILAWGMAQAVLSAWWSYEDHGHGWEPAIAVAQILRELAAKPVVT